MNAYKLELINVESEQAVELTIGANYALYPYIIESIELEELPYGSSDEEIEIAESIEKELNEWVKNSSDFHEAFADELYDENDYGEMTFNFDYHESEWFAYIIEDEVEYINFEVIPSDAEPITGSVRESEVVNGIENDVLLSLGESEAIGQMLSDALNGNYESEQFDGFELVFNGDDL